MTAEWVGLRTGVDTEVAGRGFMCCRNQNDIVLAYCQSLTAPECRSINMAEFRTASAAIRTETGDNLMKNITSLS